MGLMASIPYEPQASGRSSEGIVAHRYQSIDDGRSAMVARWLKILEEDVDPNLLLNATLDAEESIKAFREDLEIWSGRNKPS